MLISEKKKFIFIHVYKNAGTSIRSALIPRFVPIWRRIFVKAGRKYNFNISDLDYSPFPRHITAKELQMIIGKDEFNSYFSFGFVRNPWDWQVSLYKYMLKKKTHYQHDLIKKMEDFDQYIKWRCNNGVNLQKDFLYDANEQLVDFVGRFENLEEDFQKICTKIGVRASLPKKNVSNTIPYQEFYNEETKQIVYRTFDKDIKQFNYKF